MQPDLTSVASLSTLGQVRTVLSRLLLILFAVADLWLVGCYTPSGEYGGNIDADPSGPYGIANADVVKRETVGTGFDPYGGIYNYEEVDFGPPSQ